VFIPYMTCNLRSNTVDIRDRGSIPLTSTINGGAIGNRPVGQWLRGDYLWLLSPIRITKVIGNTLNYAMAA